MPAGVIQSHSQRDFNSIPVLGLVLETVTSDGSPANGKVWYRSDLSQGYIRLGGATVKLGVKDIVNADVDASAAIAESKLNLATDAAAGTGSRRTLGFTGSAAMPGTARLDQIAVPTAAVSMNGQRLTNVATPSAGTDAANQDYVLNQIDARVNGQDWKPSVRTATSAAGTLATSFANGQTVGGIVVATNDRILIKNQAAGAENGIYVVQAAGAPVRATDADTSAEVTGGMTVPVVDGTQEGVWLLTTNDAITLGTTALVFSQIGGAGTTYTASTGITLVGNDFRLVVPVTVANGGTNATTAAGARTSLGVPQAGFSALTGAITGGTPLAIAHGLGTKNCVAELSIESTGEKVDAYIVVDATNVTITVAASQSASFYRINVVPTA